MRSGENESEGCGGASTTARISGGGTRYPEEEAEGEAEADGGGGGAGAIVAVFLAGSEAADAAAEATRRRRVGEEEEEGRFGGGEEADEAATAMTLVRSRGERFVAALAAATARLVSHIHKRGRELEREIAVTRLADAVFSLARLRARERGRGDR